MECTINLSDLFGDSKAAAAENKADQYRHLQDIMDDRDRGDISTEMMLGRMKMVLGQAKTPFDYLWSAYAN